MHKNKGAGCLAIARSTIDILTSLAAQTSRGALIALAVVGVGIPTAVHAFHSRPAMRIVPQVAEAHQLQCHAGQPALPCATIAHLLDTGLSLATVPGSGLPGNKKAGPTDWTGSLRDERNPRQAANAASGACIS